MVKAPVFLTNWCSSENKLFDKKLSFTAVLVGLGLSLLIFLLLRKNILSKLLHINYTFASGIIITFYLAVYKPWKLAVNYFQAEFHIGSRNMAHFILERSSKPFSVDISRTGCLSVLGSPQANTGLIQTKAAPGIPSKSTVTSPPGAKPASIQIRSLME